jgi:2-dehydropantoate 2-reductase
MGGFQLGRPQGEPPSDPTLTAAAELLGRVLPTRIIANLTGARWSKLAVNCATSTLGAAGGDTLGRLLRRRIIRRLTLELWAELCAVADAQGVQMAPVMGLFDIRSLALSESERRRKLGSLGLIAKHGLLWALAFRYRRMRSSMAVAIERGRVPEIDYLNGEIVRRGATHGVRTPLNAALVELIHAIVAGRKQPGLPTLHEMYAHYQRGLPALAAP